ncbi:Uncharacterized protein PECH_006183 [Penicillium ucsense]|uniref:Uncharacterized protein n=1 Tax=Penicillium ucsense TaxID=2839758 RepID=A0A8J8WGT1_9EURO|nr:Uncharacterized protein PECM_006507 [Penicillium ucsense]KAF7735716.1 Uncharacterized protein PECH_006183 [Penicillium ucsense]
MFSKRWDEDDGQLYVSNALGLSASLAQLTLLAVLVVKILRRGRQSLGKGLILRRSYLVSCIVYFLTNVAATVYYGLYFSDPERPIHSAVLIIEQFVYLFGTCTTFYLLYQLVLIFRRHDIGRPPRTLGRIHGVCLIFIGLGCMLEWALYTASEIRGYWTVTNKLRITYTAYHWCQCAREFVQWLASSEILIWAVIVTIRSYKMDRRMKASAAELIDLPSTYDPLRLIQYARALLQLPAIYFLAASLSFFAVNLADAVLAIDIAIVGYLNHSIPSNRFAIANGRTMLGLVCFSIGYICFLLCFSRLARERSVVDSLADRANTSHYLVASQPYPYEHVSADPPRYVARPFELDSEHMRELDSHYPRELHSHHLRELH